MFKIEYKISKTDYDDFVGEKGYYKMFCNENVYGEIFPDELEKIMGTEYLYDWFEDMVKIALALHDVRYIALSNIESYNLWVEFVRHEDVLSISLVNADKPNGIGSVAYELLNRKDDKNLWKDEVVSFMEFKQELVRVVTDYLENIKTCNRDKNIEKYYLLQKSLKNLNK